MAIFQLEKKLLVKDWHVWVNQSILGINNVDTFIGLPQQTGATLYLMPTHKRHRRKETNLIVPCMPRSKSAEISKKFVIVSNIVQCEEFRSTNALK